MDSLQQNEFTHTKLSKCSTEKLAYIHLQLEKNEWKFIWSKGWSQDINKKEDIKNLIITTVTSIMETLEKKLTSFINKK
jgi:hypothetical protein